jgi:hypothetical protein
MTIKATLACMLFLLAGPVGTAAAAEDRDRDRLPDRWEKRYKLSTTKKSARRDTDRDGLRNLREFRRKTSPRRRDTDQDRLRDGPEVKRYKTNPRRKDTDGDGLSDFAEVKRHRTNPRKKDTDGDGVPDGVEVRRGTDPLRPPGSGVRAPAAPGAPPLLGCEPGSVTATSAAQVRSEAGAGRNVCVGSDVGNVDLDGLRPAARVVVGTQGAGRMGSVSLWRSSNIELRGRALSVDVLGSSNVRLESCTLGGTREQRTSRNLVYVHEDVDDMTIHNCDLGWTVAGDGGNNGYGIRIIEGSGGSGTIDRLSIVGNRLHNIAADGIQGAGEARDVLIDRNEIAYVAPEPGSSEHADDIQIIDHGPNLRITNNYLHHNGWFDDGVDGSGESGPYIHAGDTDAMVFENNLIRDERNFMQVGGLGTGGRSMSNLLFRRNTFLRNGSAFGSSADPEWDLDGGANNVYERNIARNLIMQTLGSHTTFRDSLDADGLAFDAAGNCTSSACNPPGQEPIGFRKPSGVRW